MLNVIDHIGAGPAMGMIEIRAGTCSYLRTNSDILPRRRVRECYSMMQTVPSKGLSSGWHSAQPPLWGVQGKWYRKVFAILSMPLYACSHLRRHDTISGAAMHSVCSIITHVTCLLGGPGIPRLAEEGLQACRVQQKGQNRSCKRTRPNAEPDEFLTSCPCAPAR